MICCFCGRGEAGFLPRPLPYLYLWNRSFSFRLGELFVWFTSPFRGREAACRGRVSGIRRSEVFPWNPGITQNGRVYGPFVRDHDGSFERRDFVPSWSGVGGSFRRGRWTHRLVALLASHNTPRLADAVGGQVLSHAITSTGRGRSSEFTALSPCSCEEVSRATELVIRHLALISRRASVSWSR